MTEVYKIEKNDSVGRYVIARKNLQAGDEILTEVPFCVGPKAQTSPVCLGCYEFVDGSTLCSTCKWPVCGSSCEEMPFHKYGECKIFSEANVQYQQTDNPSNPSPQYECITPLRMLLAKEEKSERWENEIQDMEEHMTARKDNLECWETEEINIVNFLRDKCKLASKYSPEIIHKVCSILEVNAFEIKTSNGTFIRGLFPMTAMLSHNCVSNTTHTIFPLENYRLKLRTTVDVAENEELFTSYTSALLPTFLRRENLKFSKYFDCTCARCSDPTELGTHLSSLKCTKCENGIIISSNPLDPDAKWICTHCDYTLRADSLRRIYVIIQSEINRLDTLESPDLVIQEAEKLLRQYKSVLHPQNAFNITLNHTLIQLYGRAEGYTFEDLPDILLERKIDLCDKVLKVTNILKPGKNRFRAMILYEKHVPLMLFTRNRYQYGEIDRNVFKKSMEEVLNILTEAVSALVLEDPNTPEGSIGQIGVQSLEQLKHSLSEL